MKQGDLFKKGVTIDDMLKIQEGLEKAHEDDTPIPIVTKEGLSVVGDPNKTEIKKHDYTVIFRFPTVLADQMNIEEDAIVKKTDDNVWVQVEYKDVHIQPRYDLEIQAALVRIFPYFYNLKEKRAEKKTQEELIAMVKEMCREIGDDLYDIVTVVLGVDRDLENYMDWNSVQTNISRILDDFPEIFNEAEGFSK